jgi:periplasmic protein CpxP/Spy
MKSTKTSIALAAVACLLALSPSARAQTNGPASSTPPSERRGGGPMSAEARLERLSQALTLTDAQKPQVKAVLEEETKKIQGIPREERREKMPAIREETSKQMKAILTPEQFKKYEETQLQMRNQRRGQGAPPAAAEKPEAKKEQK